ncbi:hypothetical protein IY145_21800 [Methylosinus sp. H3A]|uniref:hypothetical protein n=1 Tax=Methylosinus sp. H3A TaxID=2785786 RepID=UPI0018C250A1|nr:hypothetical protein [Methylosinus sp. H3A]MBG0811979.1 hypothetical protein [Methylosinus sp. H3A]
MRFHVGRNYRTDGARDRRTAPQTAPDLVFAARYAARAGAPAAPRKAPIGRAVFVATALAAPLLGARAYVDATRTEPAAIAAKDAAPMIRQAELPPAAPPIMMERAEIDPTAIDLTATGSTPSRQEEARPSPPPAKARRTTKDVSRSARETSRGPESYR